MNKVILPFCGKPGQTQTVIQRRRIFDMFLNLKHVWKLFNGFNCQLYSLLGCSVKDESEEPPELSSKTCKMFLGKVSPDSDMIILLRSNISSLQLKETCMSVCSHQGHCVER